MRLAFISLAAPFALLGACSDNDVGRTQVVTDEPTAATPNASTTASAPVVALGLTMDQLGDADILDASGVEIAEVERVVTDASGTVTGLLVEIEDSDPDRYVTIPLEGLTVVQDGDDQDLRGNLTRQQLLGMPATAR